MSERPFISVRKHIKWGDGPAKEDTDTLVLTSRGKYFVDVRIYLDPAPISTSTTSSSPSPLLPLSRLEWGFAGTSTSTPARHSSEGNKLESPAHSIWKHWIDSKTPSIDAPEVVDEGDMYPQPNGEVLELGEMINPETGKKERYEEVWRDLEPVKVSTDLDAGDEYVSWVLKGELWEAGTEGRKERGMVIRIGEWVQGVVRRGEEVSIRRWRWDQESKEWELLVGIADVGVPKDFFDHELKVGDKIDLGGGLLWDCVESFRWS